MLTALQVQHIVMSALVGSHAHLLKYVRYVMCMALVTRVCMWSKTVINPRCACRIAVIVLADHSRSIALLPA